ncbi:hypothetical protein A2962_04470 [Candidatus Woesebacteria bacterium RIFCSPLOWO2_01_FULL_39_61]|uniref:Methyltransferase domain-containing protein n=1 Tax=Candidatus Woesebacteria bacterium RIFCSPHIGHO2_02_FULL_39_13 TaxID=1802505 RepID=A0A1F7Z0J4_9BACT|nr:MAG: hypothetical protein A2692_00925 [Candidatus Woesebacteria bacterium RIFCSPHIGHO2_01_FULL_39_95]OGM33103.1 MAG: hypothetical protein A3D01_05075 [Candidatus Woesebacteria bacterium RIFCSPHIGHO2_02_FULL_39_13]OGM38055.1 MAG: hypothetical protein A3E13_03740 [Candidatus Woesebacteria bacterium RIFCSPHIGHO2_12_FULL_40_20]OGM66577.1 MAG: hypothetical protein A2962_04470 [Candidatus Woesebacteria bacterium RIFCSPLOWO2_01_FULL_39_61]OGM73767.1 MAG: hypothetical protein A3H19_02065 [Candidatus
MSKDFYDRVAKEFGGYSFITRKSEHETVFPSVDPENVFKSKLLEYSGKDVRVVDVGCGDCRFAFSIAGNFKEVVGVDTSIELLKVAAEKMEKNGITNVRFMEVDAGKTGFEDNSFDLSFSRRGPTPYEEIGRILKPGGRFIVIEIGEQDAREIKVVFGRGQNYGSWDQSTVDHINKESSEAGFRTEFIEGYNYDEFYKSYADLELFLRRVPIFEDFNPEKDKSLLTGYEQMFKEGRGIKLPRHRVVAVLQKL